MTASPNGHKPKPEPRTRREALRMFIKADERELVELEKRFRAASDRRGVQYVIVDKNKSREPGPSAQINHLRALHEWIRSEQD